MPWVWDVLVHKCSLVFKHARIAGASAPPTIGATCNGLAEGARRGKTTISRQLASRPWTESADQQNHQPIASPVSAALLPFIFFATAPMRAYRLHPLPSSVLSYVAGQMVSGARRPPCSCLSCALSVHVRTCCSDRPASAPGQGSACRWPLPCDLTPQPQWHFRAAAINAGCHVPVCYSNSEHRVADSAKHPTKPQAQLRQVLVLCQHHSPARGRCRLETNSQAT